MSTRTPIFTICHIGCLILLFLTKAVNPLGIVAFLLNLAILIYDVIAIATQEKTILIIQKIKELNKIEEDEEK